MSFGTPKRSGLFTIEPIDIGKCRLSTDLSEYINAILNNRDTTFIFAKYSDEIGGINAAILMNQFLESTLRTFSELPNNIQKSDIFQILNDNGHEIIKNTLDECLFSCLKDPHHSTIACLEMTISFDIDMVIVFFHDNGKGFPEQFLNHFKNDNDIYQYLTQTGSYRKNSQIQDLLEFKQQFAMPSLGSFDDSTTVEDDISQRSESPLTEVILSEVKGFGGRGLGLRNLVANSMTGYHIQYIFYFNRILPELSLSSLRQKNSDIKLFNAETGEAVIKIKLPIEPRKIKDIVEIINSKLKTSTNSIFNFPDTADEEIVAANILKQIPQKLNSKNTL